MRYTTSKDNDDEVVPEDENAPNPEAPTAQTPGRGRKKLEKFVLTPAKIKTLVETLVPALTTLKVRLVESRK